MPVWHEKTAQLVKEGKLVLLGVTQEQHPERCELFAQWKKFDWPILHDPINILDQMAVPIYTAIDEHGIIRSTKPAQNKFQADFIDREYRDDAPAVAKRLTPEVPRGRKTPDFDALRKRAETEGTAAAWRELGDALTIWGGEARLQDAITAYGRVLEKEPKHGPTLFRQGVVHRLRYDSPSRREEDFQIASSRWTEALALDPARYIWRRRIQQYGPRLEQPYAFYDWIAQAQKEIAARGDKAVTLRVPLSGAEIARPVMAFPADKVGEAKEPDPTSKVPRDLGKLATAEAVVVPAKVKPGQSVRVHVVLRLDGKKKAHWDYEAGPPQLWVNPSDGWRVSGQLVTARPAAKPQTEEPCSLEFELQAPKNAPAGPARVAAYAVYFVCEDVGGQCQYLRLDVPIEVRVEK